MTEIKTIKTRPPVGINKKKMVNKLFNLKEWWNEVGNLDNLLEKSPSYGKTFTSSNFKSKFTNFVSFRHSQIYLTMS